MTTVLSETEFVLGPTFTAAVDAEAASRFPEKPDDWGFWVEDRCNFTDGATWAAYRARDTIRAVRQEVDEVLADPLASPTEAALADRLDGLFREAGL